MRIVDKPVLQIGTTVAEIVEAAKKRVQLERANRLAAKRSENKRRKQEAKDERKVGFQSPSTTNYTIIKSVV